LQASARQILNSFYLVCPNGFGNLLRCRFFREFDVMLYGVIIFVFVSAAVVLVGGRFWRNRPLPYRRDILYASLFLLMFAGLLIMIVGSATLRRDLEMRSWPTVIGEVVSSDVVGSRAFHPDVTYSYVVDGIRYTGSSDLMMPGFGGKRSRLETAEIMAKTYPPGKKVGVHYDPEHPERSTLRAGLSYGACLQLAFGLLLYLGGMFMLPWRFRLRNRALLK
jgi:hypothetical protein